MKVYLLSNFDCEFIFTAFDLKYISEMFNLEFKPKLISRLEDQQNYKFELFILIFVLVKRRLFIY